MVYVFKESSLATSEVFQNMNAKMELQKTAVNIIKNGRVLRNEDIESAYIAVKQISDTLTRSSLKAFDNEEVQFVVMENTTMKKLPNVIPFLTFRVGNSYKTYVFADKYITRNKDGVLTIQSQVFRDLLIAANIANGIKKNYQELAKNQNLQKILMDVYCKLVCRILNRKFTIASLKIVFDIVQYYINRFFLTNIYQTLDSPEAIEKLATDHIRYIDDMMLSETRTKYENKLPTKISELLELLSEENSRMRDLNYSTFLIEWIEYYHNPGALAIDNIEYIIFMAMSLLSGNAAIFNIGASDIVKETKKIETLRQELLKLV